MRNCLLLLSLSVGLLHGSDNWPQFRGPSGDGQSDSTGLPLTWNEQEHVKWKTAIPGEGWSSPVVDDGQVWMQTAMDQGKSLRAVCVDQATGKEIAEKRDEPAKESQPAQ